MNIHAYYPKLISGRTRYKYGKLLFLFSQINFQHIISSYCATASILAGVTVTFADIPFTVNTSKTLFAGTCITSLASVHAGGPILAGSVMGAVVQICKDKNMTMR